MDRKYGWAAKKPSRVAHLMNESNQTLCKMENGSRHIPDTFGDKRPESRNLCIMCRNIEKRPNQQNWREEMESRIAALESIVFEIAG